MTNVLQVVYSSQYVLGRPAGHGTGRRARAESCARHAWDASGCVASAAIAATYSLRLAATAGEASP